MSHVGVMAKLGGVCVGAVWALLALALAGCATGPVERVETEPVERVATGPVARVGTGVKLARSAEPEDINAALRRGTQFLVSYQNKDGSWGTARRTKSLNIYAPVPGAHHSYRVAVTSLCVMALIEVDLDDAAAAAALKRGAAYLLAELPRARRDAPRALYNTWTHAYGIQALVRMLGRRPGDKSRCDEIKRQIAQQVDFLRRFESVNGGWGYYDFRVKTQRPGSINTSFTTSTGLIALAEARDVGVAAPRQLVARAIDAVKRQRNPDMTYLYSSGMVPYGRVRGINRAAGSLGRSQVCNLALRHWGDAK
ncbi:MAG: hypothetical protein ISS78_07125, partial [Phycisphaerae bacterium]|nr:hypothetical protein [Phycisphaerae bacterium]